MYNELDVRLSRDEGMSEERLSFIRRTYAHLAGAILAFIALEFVLLQVVPDETIIGLFFSGGPASWLIVLGLFMVAGWIAQSWASSRTSVGMQYLGLGLYVVAEAVIFLPLLFVAQHVVDPDGSKGLIPTAGILTLAVFGGLSLSVFMTKKDHSNLRPILTVGSMIVFGLIISAAIFGFSLGLFFCFGVVALLCGFILYQTSQLIYHFPTDQHVAAALMLFSSIATLFWYILQIMMQLSRDR
jgi:FtsH-binding integral membrane protein